MSTLMIDKEGFSHVHYESGAMGIGILLSASTLMLIADGILCV
jgi:hypothetical protein